MAETSLPDVEGDLPSDPACRFVLVGEDRFRQP
jgi:hypothetical protein